MLKTINTKNTSPSLRCTLSQSRDIRRNVSRKITPGPNAAPLMCRIKLNKVRLRSDFGATVDSDGVLVSNLIREACGKQFSMKKYAL